MDLVCAGANCDTSSALTVAFVLLPRPQAAVFHVRICIRIRIRWWYCHCPAPRFLCQSCCGHGGRATASCTLNPCPLTPRSFQAAVSELQDGSGEALRRANAAWAEQLEQVGWCLYSVAGVGMGGVLGLAPWAEKAELGVHVCLGSGSFQTARSKEHSNAAPYL